MKKSIVSLVMLLSVSWASAQAPLKMSYQCVVRKSSGELVSNRTIGLRISILQGSVSGNIVYQETYIPNPQTNANGLTSVEIGTGVVQSGNFNDIDWASGIYFLKTETDPAGGTDYDVSGTSQLLSVPYALHAKTAENGFSGRYDDLKNKPSLFSGYYSDLADKPVLFDGTWTSLSGKPSFAAVATSGSYNNLINRPSLFDGTWSSLSGKPSFADVAFSGSYNNLINKPSLFDGTWSSLSGKPSFADVAFSGSYNNLINKPSLFDGAWSSLSGKPSFADVAFSGDYNDLLNRKDIPRESTDEYTAGASQTTFTLTHYPSDTGSIKMYINGVRISKSACSHSGTTVTYVPEENGSYSLMAGDRIQIDYFY